jgi:hypothetical protein
MGEARHTGAQPRMTWAGGERPLCGCGRRARGWKNGITSTIIPDAGSRVRPCSANAASAPAEGRNTVRINLQKPQLQRAGVALRSAQASL